MSETERRLAAVLAADVAGYSRLAGVDEERTLARLRALRGDLIDPAIAAHRGRVVKRAGDGTIVEFRSVIDAVRCALEVQQGMVERNRGLAPERQILFRVGIHIGDVVGEADGDLMGDGVNIAARLEGISEPGGICLSEDAWRQVRDRLQEQFADRGEQELKNIARPVRVFSIIPQHISTTPANAGVHRADAATGSSMDPDFRRGGEKGQEVKKEGTEKEGPPRLSVVVLPFANIGGDPEQEYFVDGVTESLTTDLSRIPGSFVIARNTAFTYKGKPIDVKQIGHDLNVRYVLEGSVQRGGNRMRVNVQLIDAESGNHLWAERFDKPVADLFDMQDEIVARLARQLNAELVAAEARRSQRVLHPDALDFTFRGWAALNRGRDLENNKAAFDSFGRALALDSDAVGALLGLAVYHARAASGFQTDDRADSIAAGQDAATKALALAPNQAVAHMVLGWLYALGNQAERAVAECERALVLDCNEANAHAGIGSFKFILGRAEETEAHVVEALRLSPRDPMEASWCYVVGVSKLHLGRDREATVWLNRAIGADRKYAMPYFYLAAALAYLGKSTEATEAVAAGLALNPSFTIRRMRNSLPSDNLTYLAQRERAYDGMRKAGVPEG